MANFEKKQGQQGKQAESAKAPEPVKTEPAVVFEAEAPTVSAEVPPAVEPVVEAAAPTLEVAVAEVVAVPASAEEKMVTVVPRETISSTKIGGNYYSFRKGTPVKVPASVRALLQEKGLL